jgi:hypothetical protein
MPQQQQQQQQPPVLLVSLLEECPDVWSGVLLPKLVAAKSAGNCALTCSRLRQLCQGSQQQLNLARLDSTEGIAACWAFDALPERFTSCNGGVFCIECLSSVVLWNDCQATGTLLAHTCLARGSGHWVLDFRLA